VAGPGLTSVTVGSLLSSRIRRVTRGHGFLEEFLAHKRIRQAERLIADEARSGRILDVGCGSFPLFLQTTRFAEKYGLDRVVPPELNGSGLNLLEHDIGHETSLPFDSGFFDLVTMLAVFEHIERPVLVNLLREVRRVLKPGGMYVMTTPAAGTQGILNMMARLRLVSLVEVGEHKGLYSHDQIVALLEEAGFETAMTQMGSFEAGMNLWVRARVAAMPLRAN
jgi:SAM-dependent methyltransferase